MNSAAILKPMKNGLKTKYLHFVGSATDSYGIEIPHHSSISFSTKTITILAWVYNQGYSGDQNLWRAIISKRPSSGGINYLLACYSNTNELYFTHYDTAWHDVRSGINIPTNQWSFIAISINGSSYRFRVNTTYVNRTNSSTFTGATNTESAWIGSHGGGLFSWRGFIDSVSIFNINLSDAQITSYKDIELTGNEDNLAGHWRMNEGNGLYVRDISPNKNHALIGQSQYMNANKWVTLS